MESRLFDPEHAPDSSYMNALIKGLKIFDGHLGKVEQSEESRKYGCFQYVSFDENKFFLQMSKVIKTLEILGCRGRAKFLDVGCGIGTKVFLASSLFTKADGIEFDDNYITIAREIVKGSQINLVQNISLFKRDALSFSYYSHYDIIYLYRPFHDSEKQNKLEEKITCNAKENTIIVGTLCNFYALPENLRPKTIFTNGYLKTTDEQLLEKVKKELR